MELEIPNEKGKDSSQERLKVENPRLYNYLVGGEGDCIKPQIVSSLFQELRIEEPSTIEDACELLLKAYDRMKCIFDIILLEPSVPTQQMDMQIPNLDGIDYFSDLPAEILSLIFNLLYWNMSEGEFMRLRGISSRAREIINSNYNRTRNKSITSVYGFPTTFTLCPLSTNEDQLTDCFASLDSVKNGVREIWITLRYLEGGLYMDESITGFQQMVSKARGCFTIASIDKDEKIVPRDTKIFQATKHHIIWNCSYLIICFPIRASTLRPIRPIIRFYRLYRKEGGFSWEDILLRIWHFYHSSPTVREYDYICTELTKHWTDHLGHYPTIEELKSIMNPLHFNYDEEDRKLVYERLMETSFNTPQELMASLFFASHPQEYSDGNLLRKLQMIKNGRLNWLDLTIQENDEPDNTRISFLLFTRLAQNPKLAVVIPILGIMENASGTYNL